MTLFYGLQSIYGRSTHLVSGMCESLAFLDVRIAGIRIRVHLIEAFANDTPGEITDRKEDMRGQFGDSRDSTRPEFGWVEVKDDRADQVEDSKHGENRKQAEHFFI